MHTFMQGDKHSNAGDQSHICFDMTRDVAEHFGKQHDNVLNDIGRLLPDLREQGWFIETEPSIASNFGLFEIGVLISATREAELNFQLCPQF